MGYTFGTRNDPAMQFPQGILSRLQTFAAFENTKALQAPTLARPPDCAHRWSSESSWQPGRLHHATSWLVTCPRPWYRFAPNTSNWRGGTCTRRTAALSAAPTHWIPSKGFRSLH